VKEAGSVLGVTTAQLNGPFDYGAATDNQLRTLNHIGLFTRDIQAELDDLPRMVNPLDETEDLGIRARSYLAANCGHCHRPGVIDKADIDLRFETPLEQTGALDRIPTLASFGMRDPRIIKSGDGVNSSIYRRMLATDSNRMPPLATELVDWQSAEVIRRWIDQIDVSTRVRAEQDLPPDFALEKNFPNPFNAVTTIRYRVSDAGDVTLTVFDAAGQSILVLVDHFHMPGQYAVHWDGRNEAGATGRLRRVYLPVAGRTAEPAASTHPPQIKRLPKPLYEQPNRKKPPGIGQRRQFRLCGTGLRRSYATTRRHPGPSHGGPWRKTVPHRQGPPRQRASRPAQRWHDLAPQDHHARGSHR
jgi:hypothetical protein